MLLLGAGLACDDFTAPEAAQRIAALEERIANEWIADPQSFPEGESIWIVADLARHGSHGVPVTITIGGRELTFNAVAYESANDPFVLTPNGRETVWRRGLIAWRGTPAEEIIAVWARAPGIVARPDVLYEPPADPSSIFLHQRAFRVHRDSTRWQAVNGAVSIADPVLAGACKFRDDAGPKQRTTRSRKARSKTAAVTCEAVTFDVSFDLTFEREDPAIHAGLYRQMAESLKASVPFQGTSPTRITLAGATVPGIRFVRACGTSRGAPNDSTCLSTGAQPSP
jgi:hypothetical protein